MSQENVKTPKSLTTQEEAKHSSPICSTVVNESKSSTEASDHKAHKDHKDQTPVEDINPYDMIVEALMKGELQQNGSTHNFHGKYTTKTLIFSSRSCHVFVGENKDSGLNVAIKRFKLDDTCELVGYLTEDGTLREFYVQNTAQTFSVEGGKGSVLKALDWYVYNSYFLLVTDYDEDFKSLADCTLDQPDEHFTEDECKTIFKLVCKLVIKLNENGIFHLDIKPDNFLYNKIKKEIKLLDFGHSILEATKDNLRIQHVCGTDGLRTPQQVAKSSYYGKDVDMWCVAQTVYYCLHGDYAFKNDSEVLNNKDIQFNDDVSEDCKDLIRVMLAYNVEERLNHSEILKHSWLDNN